MLFKSTNREDTMAEVTLTLRSDPAERSARKLRIGCDRIILVRYSFPFKGKDGMRMGY